MNISKNFNFKFLVQNISNYLLLVFLKFGFHWKLICTIGWVYISFFNFLLFFLFIFFLINKKIQRILLWSPKIPKKIFIYQKHTQKWLLSIKNIFTDQVGENRETDKNKNVSL